MINSLLLALSKRQLLGIMILSVIMAGLIILFAFLFYRYRKGAKNNIDDGEYDLELLKSFKEESKPEAKKKTKTLKIVKRIFSTIGIIVVAACLGLAIADKCGWLKLGNKSVIVVASGSMSEKHPSNDYLIENNLNNQFPTYALIVIEDVDPTTLKQYDVIVYKNPQGSNIIHRIIRIEKTETYTRFVTRGDSNNMEDSYKATPEDVVGKYTGKYIPFIGAIILFVQSPLGIVTIIALIACMIILDITLNKTYQLRQSRLEKILTMLSLDENNILSLSDDELTALYNNADKQHIDSVDVSKNLESEENKKDNTDENI